MNNNKKLLIYGSVCAVILVVVITIFVSKLFFQKEKPAVPLEPGNTSLFKAVPSDAILILDIRPSANFKPLLQDTLSFANKILDRKNGLVKFQEKWMETPGAALCPGLYSLHYSSKNEVAFLNVIDLSPWENAGQLVEKWMASQPGKKRRYNQTDVYVFDDSLNAVKYDNLLILSNSSYVLESSVRHLENETSMMDNADFKTLLYACHWGNGLYINHHQIGKLFSGVMETDFLKYSDFFLRLTSWSTFSVKAVDGELSLSGYLMNNHEEKYLSSVFYGQLPGKSLMGKMLPAGTVFALSLPVANVKTYLNDYRLFLEVHKKLSGYSYKQQQTRIENEVSPQQYSDSLKIEEMVAAYCKFGEKYVWLTFIREKTSFGITEMVSSVIDRKRKVELMPYKYRGYIASVFGNLFSYCREDAYCVMDGWTVLGPKNIIEEFASGEAVYFNLEQYLSQTPASRFLDEEGVAKIVINLKEGRDSILPVIKPYYKKLLAANVDRNNFEYLTVNVTNREAQIWGDLHFYATRLKELPKPKARDTEPEGNAFIDSTVIVPKGPFALTDFTSGGKCYLEQLPNHKLRMLDAKKKGIWTIPFETPLCGAVEQVDFFQNNKLQMLFVSGNKMYLLDRLGRMVNGFPVTLPRKVVYGPRVLDIANKKEYSVLVLNDDNSVSLYPVARDKITGGVHIKAPEFVKELPELVQINGKNYLFLKTSAQMRIYTIGGKEVTGKEKKRKISPASDFVQLPGDDIKVKGVDGKEFIFNLVSGKTKKM